MIIHGDCVDVMEDLIKKKVRFESIVTDPPYELGFMGKDWDKSGIANSKYMWSLAFKLLQPGGHLLAFSGTRTYHRMVVAIEDAGFEIRDMISWLYGQGFPKSLDISKAIDKEAGVEREVVGVRQYGDGHIQRSTKLVPPIGTFARTQDDRLDSVAATDEAKQWQGWGTALKPACEPIVVARKPLIEGYTVSENVLTTGTGGLNIDGCRVGTERLPEVRAGQSRLGTFERHNMVTPEREGRWPANVVHDGNDEVEEAFAKFGDRGGGFGTENRGEGRGIYGKFSGMTKGNVVGFGDSGSTSRFFFNAQWSDEEWLNRNLCLSSVNIAELSSYHAGGPVVSVLKDVVTLALPAHLCCEVDFQDHFTSATAKELRLLLKSVITAIQSIEKRFWLGPQQESITLTQGPVKFVVLKKQTDITTITISHWKLDGCADSVILNIMQKNSEAGAKGFESRFTYCAKTSKRERAGSKHPTVKPLALMKWLVTLVTPPDGTVLDPFCGTGTTCVAAKELGFDFVGIELDEETAEFARSRLDRKDDFVDSNEDFVIEESNDLFSELGE